MYYYLQAWEYHWVETQLGRACFICFTNLHGSTSSNRAKNLRLRLNAELTFNSKILLRVEKLADFLSERIFCTELLLGHRAGVRKCWTDPLNGRFTVKSKSTRFPIQRIKERLFLYYDDKMYKRYRCFMILAFSISSAVFRMQYLKGKSQTLSPVYVLTLPEINVYRDISSRFDSIR